MMGLRLLYIQKLRNLSNAEEATSQTNVEGQYFPLKFSVPKHREQSSSKVDTRREEMIENISQNNISMAL